MDDSTFALFVLGFGTVLIAIVIWQLLSIARVRMERDHASASVENLEQYRHGIEQLDARLTALADDVRTMERRMTRQDPAG